MFFSLIDTPRVGSSISQKALIRSKHGKIVEADVTTDAVGAHEVTVVSAISVALQGTRHRERKSGTLPSLVLLL